ncbi:MAG: flagellar hook-basal body complex protein [Asticcacaulis sp.]|nr:flagellar hook-basal body complex protein [Asticcacaulis sp.]
MTINRAMQSGVTALSANAAALATISNNIANANTTGFKRVLNNYADLVSGSSNVSTYAANGVSNTVQQTLTTTGELNSSSGQYSLGIDGQGFFVTSDKSDAITAGSSMLFTRDGSFTTDTSGFLRNSAGLYLEGWPADSSGNIIRDSTDITKLGPINVGNLANLPEATTKVMFSANLNASTPISDAVTNATYDATTTAGAMSTYNATAGTGTKPDTTISMTVSDSLGQQHNITVSLLKRGVSSTAPTTGETEWYYEVSSPDIATGTTPELHQLATGSIFFDANGKIDNTVGASSGGLFSPPLTVGASSALAGAHWNASFGAASQDIDFGLTSIAAGATDTSTSLLTQVSGDSTTKSLSANGTEFGTLTKVEIGDDGMVTALYNNGDRRTIAQVAVATFINANGLAPVSGNAFTVSTESGGFTLREPGDGAAGNLAPGSLEASTVDLAQEFTGLITTQRAYSAASKVITTADDMLQELLQIKR